MVRNESSEEDEMLKEREGGGTGREVIVVL